MKFRVPSEVEGGGESFSSIWVICELPNKNSFLRGKTCPVVSVAFLRDGLVAKFVSCAQLTKFIWKPKTQFLSFMICS
jgi:hypothetical protein